MPSIETTAPPGAQQTHGAAGSPPPEPGSGKPLVVDLDNTLLRTDLLAEMLPAFVVRNPLALPRALGWLASGRARLKDELAARWDIDPATLPYNDEVLRWLRAEHAGGREIWLVSASHRKFVEAIAAHLGLFRGTLATDASRNLKGEHKRAALVERFGPGGFDYAGDSLADLAVWRDANAAIVVGNQSLAARAGALTRVERVIDPGGGGWSALPRAFRVQQWVKNGLLFVPLLTAHLWSEPGALHSALLAFFAFCFSASAIYVLNDLADLADDRTHPVKRHRPLASGELPVPHALIGAGLLLVLAIACATQLPLAFGGWLAIYLVTTTTYSAWLKRRPIVDVMCLAGLYTARLLAGAAAVGVAASFWLLAFSMFLFLSLALVKRFSELRRLALLDGSGRMSRNYATDDLPVILAGGIATGIAAVMVLALYIQSDQTTGLYDFPQRIWIACPVLLYWILRVWFDANRGKVDEDPVAWAGKDPVSWLAASLIAGAFAAAL